MRSTVGLVEIAKRLKYFRKLLCHNDFINNQISCTVLLSWVWLKQSPSENRLCLEHRHRFITSNDWNTHHLGFFHFAFCKNFSNTRIQTKIMTYVEKLRFDPSSDIAIVWARVKKFKKLLLNVFFYPHDLYEIRNIFVNAVDARFLRSTANRCMARVSTTVWTMVFFVHCPAAQRINVSKCSQIACAI